MSCLHVDLCLVFKYSGVPLCLCDILRSMANICGVCVYRRILSIVGLMKWSGGDQLTVRKTDGSLILISFFVAVPPATAAFHHRQKGNDLLKHYTHCVY